MNLTGDVRRMSFNDLGVGKGLLREPGKVGKGRGQEVERLTSALPTVSALILELPAFTSASLWSLMIWNEGTLEVKYPSQRAAVFLEFGLLTNSGATALLG